LVELRRAICAIERHARRPFSADNLTLDGPVRIHRDLETVVGVSAKDPTVIIDAQEMRAKVEMVRRKIGESERCGLVSNAERITKVFDCDVSFFLGGL
jgi:hypothetical protein